MGTIFHPSKGISGGDISNFVGIPPLLFRDISLIRYHFQRPMFIYSPGTSDFVCTPHIFSKIFLPFLTIFINIHEYANSII